LITSSSFWAHAIIFAATKNSRIIFLITDY
jgi:hypothetical protein